MARCLRRTLGGMLALLAFVTPATADTLPPMAPQRVLFVGNSLTGQNFVPRLVREIAAARGTQIEVAQFTRGDYSLEDHLREPKLGQMLREGWDILVLQQGPSSTPVNRLFLIDHVQKVVALAGADVGRVALFAPWPQRTALRTAGDSLESYRQAAIAVGGCVLPVGSAWTQHRGGDGLSMLYAADGLHATPVGSELAALVIARGLFGFEPGLEPPPADAATQRLHASAAAAYVGHATECGAAQHEASVGRFEPAQGYWAVHGAPGSGLFLEQRDGLLAVAAYAHVGDPPRPQWWLGTGTPAHGEVLLDVHAFAGGTCLECGPPGSAASESTRQLHLRFESARRAWARFDGGEPRAFTALSYGARYLEAPLADRPDAQFGPLPMPSPVGEWMFAVHDGRAVVEVARTRFDAATAANRFPAGSSTLECAPAGGAQRAGCALVRPDADDAWWFAAGDIDAQRMHGSVAGSDRLVLGHRLDPESMTAPLCDGFWSRPGRSGEGVSLQQRGDVLALTVYDTSSTGSPRWSIAAAPLEELRFAAGLTEFADGDCLGCAAPGLLANQRAAAQVEFGGARSGMLQVGSAAAVEVAATAYGSRYVQDFGGALPLSDLRGTWLFGFPGAQSPPLAVQVDTLQMVDGTAAFGGSGPDASALAITCSAGDAACTAELDRTDGVLSARFPLAAMCEEVMHGSAEGGSPVVAYRLDVRD